MVQDNPTRRSTSLGIRIFTPAQTSYAIDRWGFVRRVTEAERNLVRRRTSQWEAAHGPG